VAIALEVPAQLRDEYRGSAGQHVWCGAIEARNRRTYSLVNAPGEWPLRIVPRVLPWGECRATWPSNCAPGTLWTFFRKRSFTPREPGAARTYVAFGRLWHHAGAFRAATRCSGNGAQRVIHSSTATAASAVRCAGGVAGAQGTATSAVDAAFVMSPEPQEVELYNGRLDAARVRKFEPTLFLPKEVG